jgi:N-acetylglucosaminyldiphosphoundecaprenol N-acetyl-beta-D-mannosaminyltransferase
MSHPQRIDVLGVGISAVTRQTALQEVARFIEQRQRRYVCVTGVHGVMECQSDPELARIHNASGLTVPDGVPMVWAGRYAGAQIERVYGPDLMLAVLREAANRGWGSFLYGGSAETNRALAERIPELVPRARVVGAYSPPFRPLTEAEEATVIRRLDDSGAELVWVGLSTPKQERWMERVVERTERPIVFLGVGAAFDIHAGDRRDAPNWMRKLGLHWLYRLAREPRRLWRRYLTNIPRFVLAIARRRPVLRDI